MDFPNLVGGAWLVTRYDLVLVLPLVVSSRIGKRRTTQWVDGIQTSTYLESMRHSDNLRGHLTFHLKHEVLHLEMLCRLFERIDPAELVAWIQEEPTGQYARRSCFLYEWLTGRVLNVAAPMAGAYVAVLDDLKLVTASPDQSATNRRWRVRDNLPGTPAFCPIIRKTPELDAACAVDIAQLLQDLALEFGEDALMRSAAWMAQRESQSSLTINGDAATSERVQRFADVLARRSGEGAFLLNDASLARLQAEILGKRATLKQFGIRQSPMFVGEVTQNAEVVRYVPPPAQDLKAMLDGMAVFWERTKGQSAVMRSAVLGFGFVYTQPLADGNGRLHRLLFNDLLRRDGLVQGPMILPISTLIAGDTAQRRAYDRVLNSISRPLMGMLAGAYKMAPSQTRYPDGIRSNFVFKGDAMARPVWRYMDLTNHVVYLADVLERSIRENMHDEIRDMHRHGQARVAIKELVEMPDVQMDRVIRAVQAHKGKLTHALVNEMPVLAEPGVWASIVLAVDRTFAGKVMEAEERTRQAPATNSAFL